MTTLPLFSPSCAPGAHRPARTGNPGHPARHRWSACTAAALLACAATAHAQPAPATDGSAAAPAAGARQASGASVDADAAGTLSTVRVVGRASYAPVDADDSYQPTPDASTLRTLAPTLEVPQIVNVVPAQVLRDQRPRNLDDALANVSGISQGNTLAGTQDTIMKRGFGGNRDGSVMHNGMPLVQGRGLNAAAESVEVLKGPSSLLYGLMDPGGVVNVVSKKPQLERHTRLGVTASTFAGGKEGGDLMLDTTGPIGTQGLAWRLVLDRSSEQYWRNFGGRRETLVAPSLAWYGRDTQAVLWYEYRDFVTPFDRGTALDPRTKRALDIPRTRRLDEPTNEMRGEAHLAQLSVDHRLNQDWWAHVNASYNRETYDAGQLRVSGVNTTTGLLTRSNDATHGSLSTDTYGIAYVDGAVRLGGMRHELQFGADSEYRKYYRADLLRQAVRYPFSYLNPIYGREGPSTTVSPSDSDQTDKLHNQALFVRDSITLAPQWLLVAGLRYQAWSQLAGRGRPFVANTNTDGNRWLPQLGLVWKAQPTWSLYANYSQSLRPTSTIAPLASGMVISSAVAPETAKAYEAGVKFDLPGRVTGSVALFDIRKRNVLVSQYNDATKLTDWRTSGAARSRGLEFDAAGKLTERWSAITSAAFMNPRTTDDPLYAGKVLWNAARRTASLSLAYDAGAVFGGMGRLRFGAGAQYVGRRPGDSANGFWLPGYTVANAFATYDTRLGGHGVKFQLNVKNLLDRTYYPSSANAYFVAIGEPRQVLLSALVDF